MTGRDAGVLQGTIAQIYAPGDVVSELVPLYRPRRGHAWLACTVSLLEQDSNFRSFCIDCNLCSIRLQGKIQRLAIVEVRNVNLKIISNGRGDRFKTDLRHHQTHVNTKSASSTKLAPLNFWWRRGRVELPVQKKRPRICYKLSQLFFLTWLTSADRVQPSQSIILSPPLSTSRRWHPNFSAPNPNPLRRGQVGCATSLIRLQELIQVRQLFFCHLFNEVSGTSACNPVAYSPCRNHASPLATKSLNCPPLQLLPLCGSSDLPFYLPTSYGLSFIIKLFTFSQGYCNLS